MRNCTKFTLSTIALALCSSVAIAQEDETGFFAKANTTLAHDDNIYRVTEDLAQSDTYLSVAPELKLIGGFGKQRFELTYDGDYSKFSDASDADFADHKVEGTINLEHTLRLSSRFGASYLKEHEEPGSINRIQLNITEYNRYDQRTFLTGLAYGKEDSLGRISVDYRKTDKDYTNNSSDYLDYTSDQIVSRFSYRIAPKTRIYVEALFADLDYTATPTFELDNSFRRYRAGVTWDFTNKLTGDINLGYQDRDYKQESIRDINGLSYNGEITWSINTYTKLEVHAQRESIDSTLEEAGGFLRTTLGLSVSHDLTELLKVTGDAVYSVDELVLNSFREDKRYDFQVAMTYSFSRLVDFSATYTHEQRQSTNILAEYEANILGLNLTVWLDK